MFFRIIGAIIVFGAGTVFAGFLCKIPFGWIFGIPVFVGGMIAAGGVLTGGTPEPKGGYGPRNDTPSRWDNI